MNDEARSAGPRGRSALDRANHPDVLALEIELERQLEEACRARIARVKPMTEARGQLPVLQTLVDDPGGRVLEGMAGAHEVQP